MAGTIAKLNVELVLDSSKLKSGAQTAKAEIGGIGSSLASIGNIAVGTLLGNVGYKIIGEIGKLASAGIDFGKQMANVNSVAQLSTAQINALGDSVINLSENSKIAQGPANIAAGIYDIVSAGFSANDAIGIVTQAAEGATAGLTDTSTASNALITILDAYHQPATQAASDMNSLFEIVNAGVLTFPQLAGSLGTIIPTAAALGIPLDQIGAGLITLTRQGLSADESTTQLNAVLTQLLNPTQSLTDDLNAMGFQSGYALLQADGLGGSLDALNKYFNGNVDATAAAFTNVRAFRAILGLTTNDGKDYAGAVDDMSHAQDGQGATAKALAKQMQSADYWIKQDKKDLEILATVLIRGVSPGIVGVAKGFSFLMVKGAIPLAKFLSGGVSKGLTGFGNIVTGIAKSWKTEFGKLTAGTFAPITYGINGIVNGGFRLTKGLDSIQAATRAVGIVFGRLTGIHLPSQFRALGIVLDEVAKGWDRFAAGFKTGGIVGALDTLPKTIAIFGKALGNAFKTIGLHDFGVAIQKDFHDIGQIVGDGIALVGDLLNGQWVAAWNDFTALADDSLALFVDSFKTRVIALPLDLGALAVRFGGFIWTEAAPDVWKWATTHVFGSTTTNLLGPEGPSKGVFDTTSGGFTLPQIAVKAEADAFKWAESVPPDLWSWVTTHLFGTTQGDGTGSANGPGFGASGGITIPDWTMTVGLPAVEFAAGVTISTVEDKAKALVDPLTVKLPTWVLTVGIPTVELDTSVTAADITDKIVPKIADLNLSVQNFKSWGLVLGIPLLIAVPPAPELALAANAIIKMGPVNLAEWTLNILTLPAINFAEHSTVISQDIEAVVNLEKIAADLTGWSLVVGVPEVAVTALDIVTGITTAILAFAAPPAVGGINWVASLEAPGFPGLTVGAIATWIEDYIETLGTITVDITKIALNIIGVTGNDQSKGPAPLTPGTLGPNGEPITPLPDTQSGNGTDTGNVTIGIQFSLNNQVSTDPIGLIQSAIGGPHGGTPIAAATFTADDADVRNKYIDVFTWGRDWGKAEFTGKFNGDNSGAGNQWQGAVSYGDDWASRVFTASFEIDTTGLDLALIKAQFVAAEIAAIMPHSPAKKGPLKEPISFGYIADDFSKMADRIKRDAGSSAAVVASSFGGDLGSVRSIDLSRHLAAAAAQSNRAGDINLNGPVTIQPESGDVHAAWNSSVRQAAKRQSVR